MKWLTLSDIKSHSRVDFNIDDSLLTMYAESAEDAILNLCGMTYEEMMAEYEEVPKPIYHASLMLVELGYQQRSPDSQVNLSAVPYGFDLLVKPYIKL